MPQGTTWLDLVTLGIALGGIAIGSIGLVLTVRRDRQAGRVNLRLTAWTEGGSFVLRITNTERRTVAAERAGLSMTKQAGPLDPFDWDEVRTRVKAGALRGEPPLPHTLEPGDPAYPVKSPLYAVRGAFFPDGPRWAWCEDAYGTLYWEELPESVIATIRATKRQRAVDDDYGGFRLEEIEDDEPM